MSLLSKQSLIRNKLLAMKKGDSFITNDYPNFHRNAAFLQIAIRSQKVAEGYCRIFLVGEPRHNTDEDRHFIRCVRGALNSPMSPVEFVSHVRVWLERLSSSYSFRNK